MTDETKGKAGTEGQPNPSTEESPNPQKQNPEPQNEKGSSANPKANVDLEAKYNKLKEQYKGSTEEALRLKEENERLKKEAEAKKVQADFASDATFQQIMEDQGLEAAIDYAVKQRITSFEQKQTSEKIYNNFKASHKGLENADVLEKFDQEFARLVKSYDSVEEALEKAYVLAGGPQAEKPTQEKVEDPSSKAEESKVVQNVIGGEEDKRPVPQTSNKATELQKKINDLIYRATVASNAGRPRIAAELFAQVDELKAQLGEKV